MRKALLALALLPACSATAHETSSHPCVPSAKHAEGVGDESKRRHGAAPHDHDHDHAPHEGGNAAPQVSSPASAEAKVISHAELKSYENNGNKLVGIATQAHGSQRFEIWRTSVDVGSKTPPHRHDSEEVFVVLQGEGVAYIGDETIPFKAPATVIAPAGVPHQLENTGDVPTDSIVVVAIGSTIYDADGRVMQLPWRK